MARYALILAAFNGFVLSAVSGIVIVPFLHKLHFGQTIKEIGTTKNRAHPPWAACASSLRAPLRWRWQF